MPRASINGISLYYEEGGEGAPVTLIHGKFASLAMKLRDPHSLRWSWERDFAAYFRFVRYDRRGCYRSGMPYDGYDLEQQSSDLASLLDHLQLDSTHLIAIAAGGPIGVHFAATCPERVRSLTIAGSGLNLFPFDDRPGNIIREQLRILEREGPEAVWRQRPAGVEVTLDVLWEREEAVARGDLDDLLAQQEVLARKARELPEEERIIYYVAELRNIQAWMKAKLEPFARQVGARTLVLHGGRDRTMPPARGEALARAIPTAEWWLIENGSHRLIPRDAGVRWKVIDFIRRAEAAYGR